MLTVLLVYVAGVVVTCIALVSLGSRYGAIGPRRVLLLAILSPLLVVGLLVSGAVFAPIELAARRRRRRDRGSER